MRTEIARRYWQAIFIGPQTAKEALEKILKKVMISLHYLLTIQYVYPLLYKGIE